MNSERMNYLLEKYFYQKASGSEICEFMQLLNDCEYDAEILMQMQELWKSYDSSDALFLEDIQNIVPN